MGETILMIHGMSVGPWYWEKYKNFFEKIGYRCVATTLRFHDVDPRDAPDPQLGTVSLLDYAEDLRREIQQLGVKPIVMGPSMGGLLAQILGSRGYAKALVLLTPASPSGILSLKPSVIKSFWSMHKKWGFWRKPMRQIFNEAIYSMLHLLPSDEQKKAYEKLVYESGRVACEIGCWPFDSKSASKVDETKVTCPVLAIAGEKDRITPATVVRRVARKYAAVSTYREFKNHAHWIVGEPGWQEIAAYVADWLGRVLIENA